MTLGTPPDHSLAHHLILYQDPKDIKMPRRLSAVSTVGGVPSSQHTDRVQPPKRRFKDVGAIVRAKSKVMQWKGRSNLHKKLDVAHLVLYRLSQMVQREKSGGGSMFHPGHVNNQVLFRRLDMDKDGNLKIDEWAKVLRKQAGLTHEEVSDDDLEILFRIIDANNTGMVSVKEFAAFYRGASVSAQARGLAHETKQSKARQRQRRAARATAEEKVKLSFQRLELARSAKEEAAALRRLSQLSQPSQPTMADVSSSTGVLDLASPRDKKATA